VVRYLIRRPVSTVEWVLLVTLPFGIAGQFFPPRGLDHAENLLGLVFTALGLGVWTSLGKVRADEARERTALQAPLHAKLADLEESLRALRGNVAHIRNAVPELEAELELRTALITQLTTDAEKFDRLAQMNRVEANAVEELINRTITSGQALSQRSVAGRERLYFLAGLFLSMPVGVLVNFVYDRWIK
jgi:hypothetical protein